MNSPDRVYPIYLDPTTSLPTAADSFVSSAYPTANYDAYWDPNTSYYNLRAGAYDASTGTQYSYLKQNVDHLKGANIESAAFSIYTAHSYYPTTPTGLWIDAVSANWSPSTITWNNKPSSTPITSTEVYKGQWANFDVTSTVKQWTAGTKPNYGFKLHTNGNGKTHWKRFYASENSTNKPHLSVTYSYPSMEAPTVKATNNNDRSDTGYLDISWPSVPGAKDYIVYLYNGKSYQGFQVGDVTSWSTKGKGIWPTDEQLYNGLYQLSATGKGQELPVAPSETYTVSGGKYENATRYWVRVAAVYDGGTSSMSQEAVPYIPLSQPEGVKGSASINLDDATGYISASWETVQLATGYQVLLYNGKNYEQVADIKVDPAKPDQALQWSSQNQKLWPTTAEAAGGRFELHTDGGGMELPKDPTPVYQAAGGSFGNNPNYHVRIKAYGADHPISALSSWFKSPLPDKQELLGAEKHWPMLDTPAGAVNAINGNLAFSVTDGSFTGKGPTITLARTYNSLSNKKGSFGRGWLFSYDIQITEEVNQDVKVTEEDGSIHLFKYVSTGNYTPPHGLYTSLEKVSDQFILTTKKQDKLYFTNGRLTKIEDGKQKGNIIQLSWTATQLKLTDASGRVITFTLSNNKITQVQDYSGHVWKYAYTGDDLTGYTDPTGSTWKYGYTNGLLTTIRDAYYQVMTLDYDGSNRFDSVADTIGRTTTLSYGTNKASITHPAIETSSGTAPSTDTVTYNGAGNPVSMVIDEGTGKLNLKTAYTYEGQELVKTIDPKSGTESGVYDASGNALSVVGANLGEVTASFNENNNATSVTDALQNKYTSAHDGNQQVSANTPAQTSSAAQYDSDGNMSGSSKERSVALNWLKNSGFEASATTYPDWKLQRGGGDQGTAALTTTGAKQARAITLSPKPSATLPEGSLSSVMVTQEVLVKGDTEYTLSGLVKTADLGGRAFLNVYISGTEIEPKWIDNRSHALTGSNSTWTEQQISFKTPTGAEKVLIYMQVDNGAKGLSGGTATFDNVQLERGDVSSLYNSVSNSGFEEPAGTDSNSFPSWTYKTGSLKGVYEEEDGQAFEGKQAIKVLRKNSTDPAFTLSQTILLKQTDPMPITASALGKAHDVKGNSATGANDGYNLYMRAYNASGAQIGTYNAKFALGSHDWQQVVASINPTEPIDKVTLYLSFNGSTTGTAWFDGVRLQEGLTTSSNKYDEKGNYLVSETDEFGFSRTYEYDTAGNRTKATDEKGNVTGYTYNQMNQLETTSHADSGAELHYVYDRHGFIEEKQIRSKSDASDLYGETSYLYDDANQLIRQRIYANAQTYDTWYDYDARGEVKNITYPTGSSVTALHDSADRVTGMTHTLPGGNAQQVTAWKLDSNGNPTEVHNLVTDTKQFHTFDQGDRLTKQANGTSLTAGPAIDWKYDASDNVTDKTITNGTISYKHKFTYNSLNNNTELVAPNNDVYRFQFEETGNIKSVSGPKIIGTLYSYDERGNVTGLNTGHQSIGPLFKVGYKYDAAGNRTEQSVMQQFASRATLNGTALYTYDGLNQLTSETVPLTGEKLNYTYDDLGNRKQKTIAKQGVPTQTVNHEFNERNQLVEVRNGTETSQWTYDDNGNLLEDDEFSYEWDADNRLRKVSDGTTGNLVAEYWYDEHDRRIRKELDGVVTNFIYDGESINVLYETNSSNTITAYHTYTAGGQLLARTEVSGTTSTHYYYHYNAHGDVVMVTKGSGAAKAELIVASYVYDAWGNIVYQEGSYADKNPYRYAGYRFDTETGHYYLMARYYDAEAGVFISLDPHAGLEDNLLTQNGYSYANNNPVMMVDPNGQAALAAAATGSVWIPGIGWVIAATFVAGAAYWYLAKGGKQNVRDSGLSHLSDEEIDRALRSGKLSSKEKLRYIKEQKGRKQRDKRKRQN